MKLTKLEIAAIAGGVATIATAINAAVQDGTSASIAPLVMSVVTVGIKVFDAFNGSKDTSSAV